MDFLFLGRVTKRNVIFLLEPTSHLLKWETGTITPQHHWPRWPQPPLQLLALAPKESKERISKPKTKHISSESLTSNSFCLRWFPSTDKVLCHQKWYFCNSKSFYALPRPKEIPTSCLQLQHVPKQWSCNIIYCVTEDNTNMSYRIFSQLHGAS